MNLHDPVGGTRSSMVWTYLDIFCPGWRTMPSLTRTNAVSANPSPLGVGRTGFMACWGGTPAPSRARRLPHDLYVLCVDFGDCDGPARTYALTTYPRKHCGPQGNAAPKIRFESWSPRPDSNRGPFPYQQCALSLGTESAVLDLDSTISLLEPGAKHRFLAMREFLRKMPRKCRDPQS